MDDPRHASTPPKDDESQQPDGIDEELVCPVCGGAIGPTDVVCPHCGEALAGG